jgi:hypothetical protein
MAAPSAPNHVRAPGAVLRRALSAKLSLQTRWVPRIEVEDVLVGQGGAMVRGSGCETPSGAAAVLDGAWPHHARAVWWGLVLTVVRPPRVDGSEW